MNELIKSAIVEFKGAWPYPEAEGMIAMTNDGPRSITNCFSKWNGSNESFITAPSTNLIYWQWVCTKEEFEAAVLRLFEGAPDDATGYVFPKKGHDSLWVKDGYYCHTVKGCSWSANGHPNANIIPRPVQKETPASTKWIPEIGVECESKLAGADYRAGRLKYKSEKMMVWYDPLSGDEISTRPEHREFRPLKTEHDKLRDKLVSLMTNGYSDAKKETYIVVDWGGIADKLIDSGMIKAEVAS